MPKSLYGLAASGKNPEIIATERGELIGVDIGHELVENGKLWTLNYREPALANNAVARLLISTGTKQLRILNIEIGLGGDGYFKTIAGPTITVNGTSSDTNVDTSKLTVFNRNPDKSVPLESNFFYAPTYTASTGELRGNAPLFGGSGPFSTGGNASIVYESDLSAESLFLIEIYNTSGSAQQAGIQIEMYEE